ncbi:MAG TPA: hypothetical protein VH298_17175, partial [Jatrophihabitans sp.]|nr:hypothetical protein [Jatrophihabitans sp.]
LLAVLGSPGASLAATAAGVLPVGLLDALLGLLLAPLVRGLLRGQGIRPPRPIGTLVGGR